MANNAQRLTATIVTLAIVLALLYWGQPLLIPFAVAVILWYIIDALAVQIARLRIGGRRPLAAWSTLLSLVIIATLFSGLLQVIGDTVEQVSAAAPEYQDNMSKILQRVAQFSGIEVAPVITHWAEGLNMGAIIAAFASAIMGIAGNAGLVALYVAFLLLEKRHFSAKLNLIFPEEKRRQTIVRVIDRMQSQIRRYLYIKTLISALTGVLSYGVLLWVGVDYAPFWALLIFMLNYIPVIGSLVAVLLPTALALVQFESLTPFLTLLFGLGGLQLIIGNVIEPKVMGSSLNLSPLVVILSLSLWGELWGITGMFLSVPIAVIAMIIMAHIPATRAIAIAMSENGQLSHEPEV